MILSPKEKNQDLPKRNKYFSAKPLPLMFSAVEEFHHLINLKFVSRFQPQRQGEAEITAELFPFSRKHISKR
jgi:hypothetical protein